MWKCFCCMHVKTLLITLSLCSPVVRFHITAQPTALVWGPVKGAPCLWRPSASEDPKAAAAVCVKAVPIVCTSPPSHNVCHVLLDTFALQVFSSHLNSCIIFFIWFKTPNNVILNVHSTGSDQYKSRPCPLGYACPVRSTRPVPCPSGSFGNVSRAKIMGDCYPCPAGTFNHLPAQKACFPCGSSSTSLAG